MKRRQSWLRAALATVATGVGLACAVPPPPAAFLRVEVHRGTDLSERLPGERNVHVVLDLSSSVRALPWRVGEPSWPAEARNAARSLLRNAPAGTTASLRVLGMANGGAVTCTTPIPVGGLGGRPEDLEPLLPELGGDSESSLAAALGQLYPEIPRPEPVGRVVIISDLAEDCEAPRAACKMAARLIDAGAEIDVIAIGDEPIPACWAQLAPRQDAIDVAAGPTPRVRAEWTASRGRAAAATAYARTQTVTADVPPNGRLELPSGAVRVIVDLDPPEFIGPLLLPPGVETRVRVLDFPSLEPPVREVFVDTVGPDPTTTPDPIETE